MYIPPAFAEDRPDELREIIRAASLPVLISTGAAGLIATHLPLTLDGERLIGHFAKANAHWKAFDPAQESLAIFLAVEGYVSPSWYATKAETGKVVPTWNYEAVHAYGRLEIFERPEDILPDYIESRLKGIVGVVLHISRLEGKRKLSQDKTKADQEGVVAGLEGENPALAEAMKRVR